MKMGTPPSTTCIGEKSGSTWWILMFRTVDVEFSQISLRDWFQTWTVFCPKPLNISRGDDTFGYHSLIKTEVWHRHFIAVGDQQRSLSEFCYLCWEANILSVRILHILCEDNVRTLNVGILLCQDKPGDLFILNFLHQVFTIASDSILFIGDVDCLEFKKQPQNKR